VYAQHICKDCVIEQRAGGKENARSPKPSVAAKLFQDIWVGQRDDFADEPCPHGSCNVAWPEYRRRNDIAVSQRCKHRGMSWTEAGVLAVATDAENIKQNSHAKQTRHAGSWTLGDFYKKFLPVIIMNCKVLV